jgi:hypothetical protein
VPSVRVMEFSAELKEKSVIKANFKENLIRGFYSRLTPEKRVMQANVIVIEERKD